MRHGDLTFVRLASIAPAVGLWRSVNATVEHPNTRSSVDDMPLRPRHDGCAAIERAPGGQWGGSCPRQVAVQVHWRFADKVASLLLCGGSHPGVTPFVTVCTCSGHSRTPSVTQPNPPIPEDEPLLMGFDIVIAAALLIVMLTRGRLAYRPDAVDATA